MLGVIGLVVTIGAAVFGYATARRFVRHRLRYVDAAQKRFAPILAGIGAALIAAPIVWVIPFVGAGTAILFGAAVALGVVAGARDNRVLGPGTDY